MAGRLSLRRSVLIGWLLAAAILCLTGAGAIARLRFPDPDDAMRLVEVRDWLGGQSFWDVGQHRLNGGAFAMHWSRLVDLPLAVGFLLFDPLLGQAASDRVVMTLVPLLTLLVVVALAAALTRRTAGDEAARWAVLLVPLSSPLLWQLRPLRIDHHGWQVALAGAAALALVRPPGARSGALAGLALAALLTVSLEGLPFVAAYLAVAALAWAVEPTRRAHLAALASMLFAGALALHVATRGPALWLPACDAMAPAWLAALGMGALGIAFATWLTPDRIALRLAALAVSGGAGVLMLGWLAPACLAGPFATLDPLVRHLWYEQVTEGMPLWRQPATQAVMTVALPIVGLAGIAWRLRRERGEVRVRWLLLGALLAATTVVACLVNRVGATANLLAVPGSAALLCTALGRARALADWRARLVATTGAFFLASPGLAAGLVLATPATQDATVPRGGGVSRPACRDFGDVRALAALPPATIFLPVDLGPELLATTPHRAIAGGYHRNSQAIHRVLAAFTTPPDRARAIVLASGAEYVAGCPSLNEESLYRAAAPDGLWARLDRGERIGWLEPVSLPGARVLAWRVVPAGGKGRER